MNKKVIKSLDIADLFSGWTEKIQEGVDVDETIDLLKSELKE